MTPTKTPLPTLATATTVRSSDAGSGEERLAAVIWPRRAGVWLTVIAVLMAVATMAVVILAAYSETQHALSAVRLAEAMTAGEAVKDDLDHAIELGIPLKELPGLDSYLETRVARLDDIRFMAILDAEGQAFHRSGIGRRLDALLAEMPGTPDAERTATRRVSGYEIISLPLLDRAGWVLVASQSEQIYQALTNDMFSTVPFWLGCLALVAWWAWVVGERAIKEPARSLGVVMARAIAGQFDTVVIRRTRDAIGRCQWGANAIAVGLHARGRNFLVQAEEVRGAVFDPVVAQRVADLRDATEQELTGLGGEPPRRVFGTRPRDADVFAGVAIPAAVLGALGAGSTLVVGAPLVSAGLTIAVGVVGASVGWVAGKRGGALRKLAVTTTVALILALLAALFGLDRSTVSGEAVGAMILVAITSGVAGAAVAFSDTCRREWVVESGEQTVGPWWMAVVLVIAALGIGLGFWGSPSTLVGVALSLCPFVLVAAILCPAEGAPAGRHRDLAE